MSLSHIVAFGGTTFAGSNNRVITDLGPVAMDSFVDELPDSANVFWNTPEIDVTREELIEGLEKENPRYVQSIEEVFQKNEADVWIPKFRGMLLQGLSAKEIIDSTDLDDKILKNEVDISRSEKTEARKYVSELVDVSDGTVLNWINGTTWAPQNWDNFLHLTELNPDFKVIHESYKKDEGFHSSYRYFQDVVRVLGGYGSNSGEDSIFSDTNSGSSRQRGKFSDEVEWFVTKFHERIDDKKSIVRIKQVKNVKGRGTGVSVGGDSPAENLTSGLYTGEIEKPKITLNELKKTEAILWGAFGDGVKSLFREKEDPAFNLIYEYFSERMSGIDTGLPEIYSLTFDKYSKNQLASIRKSLDNAYLGLSLKIQSGEVDTKLDIPEGTMLKLFENVKQLRRNIPKSYQAVTSLRRENDVAYFRLENETLTRKERRQLERDQIKMVKKLDRQYEMLGEKFGYVHEKRYFFHDYFRSVGAADSFFDKAKTSYIQVDDTMPSIDKKILDNVFNQAPNADHHFHKKEYAQKVMEQFEIPEAMGLFHEMAFYTPLPDFSKIIKLDSINPKI